MRLFNYFLNYFLKQKKPDFTEIERLDLFKTTLVTVLNNRFAVYFEVLLRSLLLHNPWFKFTITIIYSKTVSPLDKTWQDKFCSIYHNINYLEADERRYQHLFHETPDHLLPALFSLECFRLSEFNQVVFLDSDMLCLGDISELFTTIVDFGACPGGRKLNFKEMLAGSFRRRIGINSGMLVIGKKYLNDKTYCSLLRCRSGFFADQTILNEFFNFRKVYFFHHKYNFHALFFWNDDNRNKEVRILHYAGPKPLVEPELKHMKIWFEYQKLFSLKSK